MIDVSLPLCMLEQLRPLFHIQVVKVQVLNIFDRFQYNLIT